MTPQERVEYLELVLGEIHWSVKVILVSEYHELKKRLVPYWTIEKTAEILGRSTPSLNRDLRMARLLNKYPALKDCRSRSDADKISETLSDAITKTG